MSIRFVKLDPRAHAPKRATEGSVGYDIWALPNNWDDEPKDTVICPGRTVVLLGTGLVVIPPFGFHFELVIRSSIPLKNAGLTLANNLGIIDSDFIGEKDEIKIMLYNPNDNTIFLDTSRPIAQLLLRRDIVDDDVREITLGELRGLGKDSRGGFGSTDKERGHG